jgi:hypothetical protein
MERGPYTAEKEQDPNFDVELAAKLRVQSKEIIEARLREIQRPTTLDEVAEVLGSTIREDKATKLILLLAGLLTFTEEDQVNIHMSAESSTGKSYNAQEVAAYFPSEIVHSYGHVTPTSFFYDEGIFDKETKVHRVDLSHRILIFLDQPHYMLPKNLRSLLSHDKKEIHMKMTDKTQRGPMRTKNVVLIGFPTPIFCAASPSLDMQELTRAFILSPETTPEKLRESIELTALRESDHETFKRWIDSHPRRRWLKDRVQAIRSAAISQIVIPNPEELVKKFEETHQNLAPRSQRDFPRILRLVKACALLNWSHRERRSANTIIASQEDIEAGFQLYSLIAKPNELGLSPQHYEIYQSVISPLLSPDKGVDRPRILAEYHRIYGRSLTDDRLRREILPALEAAGLIRQEQGFPDSRKTVVYPPDESPVSDASSQLMERMRGLQQATGHPVPDTSNPLGNRGNITGTRTPDKAN